MPRTVYFQKHSGLCEYIDDISAHSLLSVNNETSWISDPTTEQEAVCLTHIFKPFTSLSSLCKVCPQSAMACLVPNSTVENSHHIIWETPVCRLISEQLCTTISAGSPPLCDCYQKASSGLACHSGLERKEEGGGGGHTGSFDAVLTSVTAGIVPAAAHTVTTRSPQPSSRTTAKGTHRGQSEMALSDTISSSFIKLSLSACWYTGKLGSLASLGTTSYWLFFGLYKVLPHTKGTETLT